jgi:hypothetical protein
MFPVIQNMFRTVQNMFPVIQNMFRTVQNMFPVIQNMSSAITGEAAHKHAPRLRQNQAALRIQRASPYNQAVAGRCCPRIPQHLRGATS